MNVHGGHVPHSPAPPGGPTSAGVPLTSAVTGGSAQHPVNHELSFEDFTAMNPFLDPAALHLAGNPYASSLASSAAMASSGESIVKNLTICQKFNDF